MAGFFQNIGEFFTGKEQSKAEDQQADERAKLSAEADKYSAQSDEDRSRAIGSQNQLLDSANQADKLAGGYRDKDAAMGKTAAAQRKEGVKLGKMGTQALKAQRAAMGGSTEEYMANANKAAQGQASQAAQAGSTMSARQALKAARGAGLSKGQAALGAGQAAGDAYTQQYQSGLESGRNQYQSGTQQFGQAGAQNVGLGQAGQALGNSTSQVGQGYAALGGQQQGLAQAGRTSAGQQAIQQQGIGTGAGLQARTTAGGFAGEQADRSGQGGAAGGGFLGGALDFLTSDENCKENIEISNSPLEELVAKVRPVDYNYTEESGEDSTKNRVGVIAQDLEKTSMKDNVVHTDEGLKVDTGQQTLSNTNLIVQLAEELFSVKSELKKLRGDQ